jgi:hypothetical protein
VDQKRIGVPLNRRVKIELAKTQEFIGEELHRAVQETIDQFGALGPFALHCGYEDRVIEQIP